MAKNIVSSHPPRMKKAAQPINHPKKRHKLKALFKNVLNYMKSDTYMFAPLINPQSGPCISSCSPGGMPVKKLAEKRFVDYLKSDCYMYAPFYMDSASDTAAVPSGYNTVNQTITKHGNSLDSCRSNETDDRVPAGQIAVKHIVMQEETVKHVVRTIVDHCLLQEKACRGRRLGKL